MIPPHDLVEVAEDIFDEIGFELDLCPRSAIELHVRRAFIDFCEKTRFWLESVTITAAPGESSYEILLPSGLGLIDVVSVIDTTNSVRLEKSHDPAVAYRFWVSAPGYIQIFPQDFLAPIELDIVVAVRPSMAPDFRVSRTLQEEYRPAFIAGAKAALYKIPGKAWFSPQLAQVEQSTYDAIVNDARLHVANGYSRMPLPSVRKNRPFY